MCKRVRAAGGTFAGTCHAGPVRRTLETAGLVEYLRLDEVEPLSRRRSQ
jgi:anti-anti-sigma regulatory factor